MRAGTFSQLQLNKNLAEYAHVLVSTITPDESFTNQIDEDMDDPMAKHLIDEKKEENFRKELRKEQNGKQQKDSTQRSTLHAITDSWTASYKHKIEYISQEANKSELEASTIIEKLWKKDWTLLDWLANPKILETINKRQQEFLKSPKAFRPQPFLYRPILAGMGWGNLLYDISFHVIFACLLDRPLLIYFDRKDPTGRLGWNVNVSDSVFQIHPEFDWRWSQPDLLALYDPKTLSQDLPSHVHVTCRKTYRLHSICGGDQDQGNLEPLLQYFRENPGLPLYSEYSASFIRPLMNSQQFRTFITTNLNRDEFPAQIRFGFNLLFQINPSFRQKAIFPYLKLLTNNFQTQFVTSHIRTGHLETGVNRGNSLSTDLLSLKQCRDMRSDQNWLLLTDNAELSTKARNFTIGTLESTYSLHKFHVGFSKDFQKQAWEVSLTDWLLLVESTGPILLRTRMHSAFSFGERGSFLGGKACSAIRGNSLMTCGSKYFDKMCSVP